MKLVACLSLCCLLFPLPVQAQETRGPQRHSEAEQRQRIVELFSAAEKQTPLLLPSPAPSSWREILLRSPWRNSLQEVIHLLLRSPDATDRRKGWEVAAECGELRPGTLDLLVLIVEEPDEKVKCYAISVAAEIGCSGLGECVERVLADPRATERAKGCGVRALPKLPDLELRTRLWLIASADKRLMADCVATFNAVRPTEATLTAVCRGLDERVIVHVAMSDHFGLPFDLRVLTCQALESISALRERAAMEIGKRCPELVEVRSLDFHVSALTSMFKLDPDSKQTLARLTQLYDQVPEARPLILAALESANFGQWENSKSLAEFEIRIIAGIPTQTAEERCSVCQWLSSRRSDASFKALQERLHDPHPGVRVAAAVAITQVDPLFDLNPVREELLRSAADAPDEFGLAFPELSDAIQSLALAGQTKARAIEWLTQERDPRLHDLCHDVSMLLSVTGDSDLPEFIPWKRASFDSAFQ